MTFTSTIDVSPSSYDFTITTSGSITSTSTAYTLKANNTNIFFPAGKIKNPNYTGFDYSFIAAGGTSLGY